MRNLLIALVIVSSGLYCCSQAAPVDDKAFAVQLPDDKDPLPPNVLHATVYNRWFEGNNPNIRTVNYFMHYSPENAVALYDKYRLVLFINTGSQDYDTKDSGAVIVCRRTHKGYEYKLITCAVQDYIGITIIKL